MKSTTMLTTLTLIATLSLGGAASAQNGRVNAGSGGGSVSVCQQALTDHLALLPVGYLDNEEAAVVVFMREEEKLARDVYVTLSLRWDLPVFSRIARSEQRHMNLVALLIDRYELVDPIADDGIGVFTDPQLGALYEQLVAAGKQSLLDALVVGATIEDLDLADLEERMLTANDLDVDLIGENLAAGTRNHLRAFVGAITAQGGVYVPQYIDPALFTAFVTSAPERGVVYDEFGDILAECGTPGGGQGGNGGPAGGGPGSPGGNAHQSGPSGNGGQGGPGGSGGPGTGDGTGVCDGTGAN